MFFGLFGSDQQDATVNGEVPFNYEDCVDASEQYVNAVDVATDTFSNWVSDESTGWGDVVDTGFDAVTAHDHKETVCDFGEDKSSSFDAWHESESSSSGVSVDVQPDSWD